MAKLERSSTSIAEWCFGLPACARALFCALAFIFAQLAQAQTYSVLHFFEGTDGNENPTAGVTIDQAGHLYSTTYNIWGSVFEMRTVDSNWFFSSLFSFPASGQDGLKPYLAGVIKGPDGALYGTAVGGGGGCSCGVVFRLQPPPTTGRSALEPWTETVLWEFRNAPDGKYPSGNLVFDSAGNLYGTTERGGAFGSGAVFKLSPEA